jgi:hypothetical protein
MVYNVLSFMPIVSDNYFLRRVRRGRGANRGLTSHNLRSSLAATNRRFRARAAFRTRASLGRVLEIIGRAAVQGW